MNRIVALPVLAVAAVALSACGSDEDKPSLIGTKYTNELSNALLQKTFPDTSAPPGVWNLEITEYDKVVVDAPDGGGFSLAIKSLKDDRITLQSLGCKAADGSDASTSVYDIKRDGDDISFTKVKDECADKDPEAALLPVKQWKGAGKSS
jgi:hypothetical protein